MSSIRKFGRNKFKQALGGNGIRDAWERRQIERYGYAEWLTMRIACDPKKRRASTLYGTGR